MMWKCLYIVHRNKIYPSAVLDSTLDRKVGGVLLCPQFSSLLLYIYWLEGRVRKVGWVVGRRFV